MPQSEKGKSFPENYPVTATAIVLIGSWFFPTIVLPIVGCSIIIGNALKYDGYDQDKSNRNTKT